MLRLAGRRAASLRRVLVGEDSAARMPLVAPECRCGFRRECRRICTVDISESIPLMAFEDGTSRRAVASWPRRPAGGRRRLAGDDHSRSRGSQPADVLVDQGLVRWATARGLVVDAERVEHLESWLMGPSGTSSPLLSRQRAGGPTWALVRGPRRVELLSSAWDDRRLDHRIVGPRDHPRPSARNSQALERRSSPSEVPGRPPRATRACRQDFVTDHTMVSRLTRALLHITAVGRSAIHFRNV